MNYAHVVCLDIAKAVIAAGNHDGQYTILLLCAYAGISHFKLQKNLLMPLCEVDTTHTNKQCPCLMLRHGDSLYCRREL